MPALQCYGFVRFAHLADAEGVLEFAQQQGMWADERMLRINWAQGSMPDWKVRSCCQMGQCEAGEAASMAWGPACMPASPAPHFHLPTTACAAAEGACSAPPAGAGRGPGRGIRAPTREGGATAGTAARGGSGAAADCGAGHAAAAAAAPGQL